MERRINLKDYLLESRIFLGRTITSAVLVTVLLLLLLARLVYLQVVSHDHFITLSRDNRVRLEPLPPTRGLIYDRNGVILAQNLPSYSLEIIPEKTGDIDATIDALAAIVPIEESDRRRFERLRRQHRRFDSIPIRVRLNDDEVARLAVNQHRFPGVDVRARLLRDYPAGDLTAHILGYVGRISEHELNRIDVSNYAGTQHIGKLGVERSYEERLHGVVGHQQVEVNAKGRVIRVLEKAPPQPGDDLHLFLDIGLQRAAIEALGDARGAVVAIDPRSGGVLALASNPSFDPNLFVEGISTTDYRALQESPAKPLFNRALRGQYPPGSTVKPFIGLAGLQAGSIGGGHKVYCNGTYRLPGSSHKYRDWKRGGHGPVDLKQAIIQSCDVYYYELAREIGIDRLHDFLSRFGFGAQTGADLVGELPGLLPSRDWKRANYNAPWYPGETLIMGIGQGYFLTTPLQLASATATLAMRGTRITPRVVAGITPTGAEGRHDTAPEIHRLDGIEPGYWGDVVAGMAGVVESPRGTAKRIHNPDYRIAGKTGTAQVFSVGQEEEYKEEEVEGHLRDHALFIAFAPIDAPRIAVAVVVENGGHGGAVAAPIAQRLMDLHLLGRTPR